MTLGGIGSRRATARRIAALPDLLEVAARELRAGTNLHHAMEIAATDPTAAPTGIDIVVRRVRAGQRLADALDEWAAAFGHPDADLLRAVLILAAGTGGSMAESLEQAAGTLRERAALHDEIQALTAQVRVSSLLLSLAPVGFLVSVGVADPATVGLLLIDNLGRAAMALGLALDAVGFWWMHRMISAVTR